MLTTTRLGKICAMATLTASSAELTALLKSDPKPHSAGAEAAINIAFIALTTLSHCLGVKVSYALGQWRPLLIYVSCMARSNEYVTLSKIALGVDRIRVAFYKTTIELEVYISPGGVYLLRFSNVYAATCDTDFGYPGDGSR